MEVFEYNDIVFFIIGHVLASLILQNITKAYPRFLSVNTLSGTILVHYLIFFMVSLFFTGCMFYAFKISSLLMIIFIFFTHFIVYFIILYIYVFNIGWTMSLFYKLKPLKKRKIDGEEEDEEEDDERDDEGEEDGEDERDDEGEEDGERKGKDGKKDGEKDGKKSKETGNMNGVFEDNKDFPEKATSVSSKETFGKIINISLFYPVVSALCISIYPLISYTYRDMIND